MSILEEVQKIVQEFSGELKEKKGIYELIIPLAERKAFLNRQKLEYVARFRLHETEKRLVFTEMLKESGAGLASGDSGMSLGFGVKKETYNTLSRARSGTIEEQSRLFGKKYEYRFDFRQIRQGIEKIARENGYEFQYQITPFNL